MKKEKKIFLERSENFHGWRVEHAYVRVVLSERKERENERTIDKYCLDKVFIRTK
jgi:hypothetical protein